MSPVLTQYVSQPITLDEQTQKMKQHLLQDIRPLGLRLSRRLRRLQRL